MGLVIKAHCKTSGSLVAIEAPVKVVVVLFDTPPVSYPPKRTAKEVKTNHYVLRSEIIQRKYG